MSRSRSSQPNQPEFTTSTPAPLCCPICGGAVVKSWWTGDLLICQAGCYWSGRESVCKPPVVDDGDNVLYASGDS